MDYVAIVVTFLAALLAVRGNTWVNGKPTAIGWVGAIVALVGLVATIAITRATHEENVNQRAALETANAKLGSAEQERSELAKQLEVNATLLVKAEEQRKTVVDQVAQTNKELTTTRAELKTVTAQASQTNKELEDARADLKLLRAHQDQEEHARAEFEARYAEARGIIKFLLTGECDEQMPEGLCFGFHSSWAGTAKSHMDEGSSAYDAIMKRLSNTMEFDKSTISEYGPRNTNAYAAEILQ